MQAEQKAALGEAGRHGRLSPDYAQEILSLGSAHSGTVAAAGRLSPEYVQAVAELLMNPAAFSRVILDERFDRELAGWPDDRLGEARRVEGGYRMTPRLNEKFFALGAPVGTPLRDVVVGATFRKLGGPPGGVYGLLLRDRGPEPRDGRNQTGRYYVAQASDRGDVGIWRRELDRWVDLVPWTRSAAVGPGEARNDLSFEVVGARLIFVVNGMPVATANDAVLDQGGVGVFVGGDGNDVLLQRFVVRALS
jgi:hypothetical protein